MNIVKIIILLLGTTKARIDHEQILDDLGLKHNDRKQAGCPKIHDIRNIKNFKNLYGQWRVAYMSSTWMRGLAKSIHQIPQSSQSGLDKACIKVTLKPYTIRLSSGISSNSSLSLLVKCPKSKLSYKAVCKPNLDFNSEWYCVDLNRHKTEKEETMPVGYYLYLFQYEFFDGVEYALVVKCLPKVGMNWTIVTKQKFINPKIIKRLLRKVSAMGFDVRNIIELSHDKC